MSEHKIISREEALALGLKRYFTGKPCRKGHVAERSTKKSNHCIECRRLSDADYTARTKDKKAAYDREYRAKNAEALSNSRAEYRLKNRDKLIAIGKEFYHKNKERHKEYRRVNREKRNQQKRDWDANNKEHTNRYANEYNKRRMAEDLQYKLQCRLRQRFVMAVRNGAKGGSAVRDLGCSIADFKRYIESKFQCGMTWNNWGITGWHLDHIKPLSSFDLTNPEQVKIACHYTNIQPLWSEDNLSKGKKLPNDISAKVLDKIAA